jgi:hypothetical protein
VPFQRQPREEWLPPGAGNVNGHSSPMEGGDMVDRTQVGASVCAPLEGDQGLSPRLLTDYAGHFGSELDKCFSDDECITYIGLVCALKHALTTTAISDLIQISHSNTSRYKACKDEV